MPESELKPCPFCGGRAHLWRTTSRPREYQVSCEDCVKGKTDWVKTSKAAIETWNRRAEVTSDGTTS